MLFRNRTWGYVSKSKTEQQAKSFQLTNKWVLLQLAIKAPHDIVFVSPLPTLSNFVTSFLYCGFWMEWFCQLVPNSLAAECRPLIYDLNWGLDLKRNFHFCALSDQLPFSSLPFFAMPCLAVAVQSCMEWLPIKSWYLYSKQHSRKENESSK